MTALQQQKIETETKAAELTETELSQVTGGIIAVLQAAQMCDGSVRPVSPQAQKGIIAI